MRHTDLLLVVFVCASTGCPAADGACVYVDPSIEGYTYCEEKAAAECGGPTDTFVQSSTCEAQGFTATCPGYPIEQFEADFDCDSLSGDTDTPG